ncbi:peptidoglycan DD-metalloendopeptidase family protein [bacterium]|nr:peptidoglycan DD-metalloendopeptidase family protein [bacterium]
MTPGDAFRVLRCYSSSVENCVVQLSFNSNNNYQVRIGIPDDAAVYTYSVWFNLVDGWNAIEIFWTGGMTGSTIAGSLTLWVNGEEMASIDQINNDSLKLESVWLGINGADAGTSGSLYIDDYESHRYSYIGLLPEYDDPDLEPTTPASWKGNMYAYDSGQPHAVSSVTRDQQADDPTPKVDSYAYDANGNMTCRYEWDSDAQAYQLWEQLYNAENRLEVIRLMDGTGCASLGNPTETWTFTYNGDGIRVMEVHIAGTTTTTRYFFAGGAYEVSEVNDGSTTTTETKRYYSIAGMRVAMRDDSDTYYFAADHLSSASVVMSDAGALLSENRYMPFGEVRDIESLTEITETDFSFTGQRNYEGFGLMDYNARFYSPTLGRFTQPDSIVPDLTNSQAWNRYSYSYNNPLNYTDPSGHTPIVDDCEFFGECSDGGHNRYEPVNPWGVDDNISELITRWRKRAEFYFLQEFNLPLHPDDVDDVDVDGYSYFGGCNTLTRSCDEMHASVDSQGPYTTNQPGRPIYPVAYGTIAFEGTIGGFGNYIVVEHDVYGEKFYSVYAHLQVNDLQPVGSEVDNNIQIGEMGSSGTDSVHLHFEVRKETNVNSNYGVGGMTWWPSSLDAMHANFVDLSSIFGIGKAFSTIN